MQRCAVRTELQADAKQVEAEREAGWQDVRVKDEDDDGATIGGVRQRSLPYH